MPGLRAFCTVALAMLCSQVALASPQDPGRKALLPAIRAATNCISREALLESALVDAVRGNRLPELLWAGPIGRCNFAVQFMIAEHDQIYGYGTGENFASGPYLADLPRAVMVRIKGEVDRRIVETDRLESIRTTEAARLEGERKAAAEKREAQNKIDADKLESEQRAQALEKQRLKHGQLEVADKTRGVLRDRMIECAKRELAGLVKSGEAAEVLANATMTICAEEIENTTVSVIEYLRIEATAQIRSTEEMALRADTRSGIRAQFVALAVKAKAVVNNGGRQSAL